MQENDQSRRAGRPSLLTEKTPEGDSGSILSKLDGRAGAPRSSAGAGRVAGIAAAVALTGGAIGWVMSSADTPAPTPLPVATVASQPHANAAGTAPASSGAGAAVVSGPSAAKVVTVASPGGDANGSDVSAAAILEETPAKHESGAKSLAASLEAPSPKPAAAAGGKDELIALLDKPHMAPAGAKVVEKAHEPKAEPKVVPKREPVKLAKAETAPRKDKAAKEKAAAKDKARQKEKTRTVAAAEKKRPAKAKPKAPVDSDAALLAALLTHTKKAPARKMTEYQRCSTRETVAAADKCRERLCASAKAPAECKPPRVAKAEN